MNINILLPHNRRQSYFITSYRNAALHAITSAIIYPLYLLFCHVLIEAGYTALVDDQSVWLPEWLPAGLRIAAWAVVLLPLLLEIITPRWWRTGFDRREVSVLVSGGLSLVIMLCYPQGAWVQVLLFAIPWLLLATWRATNSWQLRGFAFLAVMVLGGLLFFLGNTWQALMAFWGIYFIFGFIQNLRNEETPFQKQLELLLISGIGLIVFLSGAEYLNFMSIARSILLTIPGIRDIPAFPGLSFLAWLALIPSLSYAGWRIVRRIREDAPDDTIQMYWRQRLLHGAVSLLALGITGLLLIGQSHYAVNASTVSLSPAAAAFGLLTLLIAARPDYYLSRQRANFRWLFATIRHDILHDRLSPLVAPSNVINRLWRRRLPRFFSVNNRTLYVMILLVIGGLVVPAVYYAISLQERRRSLDSLNEIARIFQAPPGLPSPLELMAIGIVSAFILVLIYMLFWLFHSRSRYIVSEFSINAPDDMQPEIRAIAKIATQLLVEELQHISNLLKLRQVENVNLSFDDNNVFFVTSGIDQDFINQLQQVVTIDVPQTPLATPPVNLGQLAAVFFRLLARIRVQGKIQQRSNGNLEIWAQIVYRNNRSAAVEQVIQPENSIIEIDEILMRPVARELALKLFIELGQVTHLGSNFQSLNHLLVGLNASAERNWWRAISFYRRALQIEEARQREFGIGHYHLGAALVFQGDWQNGIEHLQTAELDGPLMAETQYMLALALVYRHWSTLHRRPNIFNEVNERLQLTIALRPEFPEAYQLWGTACYRRGRLQERYLTRIYVNPYDKTESNSKQTPPMENYRYYYRLAARYFQQAIRLYDAGYARLEGMDATPDTDNLIPAITRQRVTAAHQMGDALRSLGYYQESDSYYRDVIAIDPRNLRNLIDLSKTYCLQSNWQRAETFIWQAVFNHDVGYWDADACLHMGWALAGGIREEQTTWVKRLVDKRMKKLYRHRTEGHATRPAQKLGQAFQYLDYAIHQRPRYITAWRQTDWYRAFNQALRKLEDLEANNPFKRPDGEQVKHLDALKASDYLFMPLVQFHKDKKRLDNDLVRLKQMRVWLALRMDSYDFWRINDPDGQKPCESPKKPYRREQLNSWCQDKEDLFDYLNGEFEKLMPDNDCNLLTCYDKLKHHRQQVELYLESIQNTRRATGLALQYERLRLTQNLYEDWKKFSNQNMVILTTSLRQAPTVDYVIENKTTDEYFSDRSQLNKNMGIYPHFMDRFLVDIYAEFTLLTARMLAESGLYDDLYHVVAAGIDVLDNWLRWWRNMYELPDDKRDTFEGTRHDSFSPRVTRYQQASLYAWRAYARLFMYEDLPVQERVRTRQADSTNRADDTGSDIAEIIAASSDVWLHDIESDLKQARQNIRNHPLILYVQAKLYTRQNLHRQAIEEFERLIDLMSPYDPKQEIANTRMGEYTPRVQKKLWQGRLRNRMYMMERVCGRQQFYNLIDLPRVHMEIATTYRTMDLPTLRVNHLFEALRWSSYHDLDLDNFLRMANQLNNIERYDEAKAIVEALQRPGMELGKHYFSDTRRQMAAFLSCLIATRAGRFGDSMHEARNLARRFRVTVPPLNPARLTILKEVRVPATTPRPDDVPDALFPFEDNDARRHYFAQFKALYRIADALLHTHQPGSRVRNAIKRTARHLGLSPNSVNSFADLIHQTIKTTISKYSNTHPFQQDKRKDYLRIYRRLHHHRHDGHTDKQKWQMVQLKLLVMEKLQVRVIEDPRSAFEAVYREPPAETPNDARVLRLEEASRRAAPALSNEDFRVITGRIYSLEDDALWQLMQAAANNIPEQESAPLSLDYARMLLVQMVSFISREYSNKLSQIADLSNVLAYNRAETGLRLRHGYEDSACAAAVMSYMMNLAPDDTSKRLQFARKLAQFYDTCGWVRYRDFTRYHSAWRDNQTVLSHATESNDFRQWLNTNQGQFDREKPELPYHKSQLQEAEHYLRYGIRYDQQRAIIHYHLARVYLTRAEIEWQLHPDLQTDPDTLAPYLDTSITQAFRHWRQANDYDRFNRLHGRLSWLYNRISEYKHAWEKRQLRGIAGDADAEFLSSFAIRPGE